MKVYIILAHPNQNGLCYAAFENIQKGLIEAGHDVKVTDLYQDGFDPVLVFDETRRRRDMQFAEETQEYREHISWADRLVFIFPVWWAGMPAILKGFIDKVFATGFAYDFKGLFPVGHLKGKTAWIVNTHDTPSLYASLVQQDYGKILKRQILKMCGIKTKKHFVLPSTKRTSLEQRQNWLKSLYDFARKSI